MVSYYDVPEAYWADFENFDFSLIFGPRIAENSMYGAKIAKMAQKLRIFVFTKSL